VAAFGAIAPFPDTLFEPVDGDPALRQKVSDDPANRRSTIRHMSPSEKRCLLQDLSRDLA
jgi:hypothetical protein